MVKNEGYYKKYTVIDNATGEEYEGRTFTIKIDEDPSAAAALEAYADDTRMRGFEVLADALDDIVLELAG